MPHSRFHETNVSFQLTVKQANAVATSRVVVPGSQRTSAGLSSAQADYNVQIQLRFALLEVRSPTTVTKTNACPATDHQRAGGPLPCQLLR